MDVSEAFSPGRALNHGLVALRRTPASLVLGGVAMAFVDACTNGSSSDFSRILEGDHDPEVAVGLALAVLGILAVSLVLAFVAFFVRCWLLPGWLRLHRHVLEHGTDAFHVLFGGGDAFGRMILWRLLFNVIAIGTFIVAALPGGVLLGVGIAQESEPLMIAGGVVLALLVIPSQLYIMLGTVLGDRAVALEGMGPMEALDRSWELARGNRLTLFVYFFLMVLVNLAGVLMCCIGVFATRPITDVGTTESYLLAIGTPGVDRWVVPVEAGGM